MSAEERPDEERRTQKKKDSPRRIRRLLLRLLTIILTLTLLPVLLFASACMLSRTDQGERWILTHLNRTLQTALVPVGLSLRLEDLHSNLPFALSVNGIELSDAHGIWFRGERLSLAVNWRALVKHGIEISDLCLESPALLRMPELQPASDPEPASSSFSLTPYNLFQFFPAWLAALTPELRLDRLVVNGLELAPGIAGDLMLIDLTASASLSPTQLATQAALSRRETHGGPIGETLILALSLTHDAVLGLHLTADAGPSGIMARILPPDLAKRPEMRVSLKGHAPLDQWKGSFGIVLDDSGENLSTDTGANSPDTASIPETDSMTGDDSEEAAELRERNSIPPSPSVETMTNIPDARRIAALTGQVSFALPPQGEITDTPWLPHDIVLNLTVESGQAAEGLALMPGLTQGDVSAEVSLRTTLEQKKAGLTLDTRADISARVEQTRWEDARLAVLLGNTLNAALSLRADYTPEGMKLELPALSLEAGILFAKGRGVFSVPSLSGRDTDFPMGDKDKTGAASPAEAHIDAELHAVARPGRELAAMFVPETGQSLTLEGPARLDAMISGPPLSPTARVDLTCPGLTMDGKILRNIFLHARLDNLKDESSDIALTGGLEAGLSLRGESIDLKTDWDIRRGRTGTLDAALRNASMRGGGIQADGGFTIRLEEGKTPCLDGGLLAEVQDWKHLSALTGRTLNGSRTRFELTLKHEGEKQFALLKGGAASFSLDGTANEENTALALSGLHVSLDARDIWNATTLDASANVSGLDAGGIVLKDISSGIRGSLSGPLALTASTEGGVKTRIDATWNPGMVALKEFSVEPGPVRNGGKVPRRKKLPSSLPGIVLLSPGKLTYSASSFSTPGLDFRLPPEGKLTLRGTYDPARINLDMDLKGLQFAPLRMFARSLPDGNLSAALNLRGTLDRPAGTLRAEVRDVRFPGSELVPLACDLNAELKHPGGQSVLDAKLEVPVTSLVLLGARQGWARVRLPLEHSGSTLLPARNRSMTASLRWDGVVSPLWAYLPIADRRMAGGLHLAADISGTLSQPKIDANVELSNAAFEDLALGILLKNINARAAYTDQGGGTKRDAGRQASLALSGEDGQGGTIRLDGSLDLTARSMQASLNMNKLKPLRRQDLRISLSGDGLVMGTLEAPFVNANITVNEGEFSLAHLPSGGIRELPISSGEETETPPPRGVLSVRIDVPRRFFVRGRGLESEWKGNLHIGGPLNAPGILGSIDVVRGDFELLNRDFTFSKGSIQFAGSQKVDPRLDIVMTYTTSAIVAEAIVGGSASRPSFRLASQPSLPEDEIISQIMFGKYARSLGRFEAIQLAGGVAALAGIGNGGLGVLSSTREALGVDMLRLNSSSNSDSDQNEEEALTSTTLEMGKYINDKVYVGIEQGMKSDSTGALVEIELTPEISLEAKTNSERTEAAIQWQHNY